MIEWAAIKAILGPIWNIVRWPVIGAAVLLLAYCVGKHEGRVTETASCTVNDAKAETKAAVAVTADVTRQADNNAAAETTFATDSKGVQDHVRIINREVVRYVETHSEHACSLDADGMRIWTDANAGASTLAPAADIDGGVPTAPAADQPAAGGSAGEPRGGDEPVPRVPGAAEGAGAVGDGELKPNA